MATILIGHVLRVLALPMQPRRGIGRWPSPGRRGQPASRCALAKPFSAQIIPPTAASPS